MSPASHVLKLRKAGLPIPPLLALDARLVRRVKHLRRIGQGCLEAAAVKLYDRERKKLLETK